MNDYELFLSGCYGAVVKIRRFTDDFYNFCVLMEKLGFKDKIRYFEDCRSIKEKQEKEYVREEDFSEDLFFHIANINNVYNVCIEYQLGKGFTFGDEKDYNDDETKILSVEDLIRVTGYESQFMLDGEEISLQDINKDYEDLDNFCEFYDWRVQKFGDLYNILDIQTEEFKFDESVNLDKIIERIYFRMFDYWTDEEDIEGLIEEGSIDYVKKVTEDYFKVGLKLGILTKDSGLYKQYSDWYKIEVLGMEV